MITSRARSRLKPVVGTSVSTKGVKKLDEGLKDKVALITGASRGLGRCLCEYLSDLGIKVVAIARSIDNLKNLEEKIKEKGGIISTYQLDVTDFEGIGKVVNEVIEKWGTIDILINNAGTSTRSPLESLKKEEIDLVIDTNLKGTIYFTRHVVPVMIKAKKGHIINISSTAGIRGSKGNGTYNSSKFGVVGFSDSISKYLMEHGIHVVTLCPGGINTTWWDRVDYSVYGDRDKLIPPLQVAKLVEFILNGDSNTLFKQVIFLPVNEIERF